MSRQNIIDTAASQNGTKENPPNSNRTRYGEWYGMNGITADGVAGPEAFNGLGLKC